MARTARGVLEEKTMSVPATHSAQATPRRVGKSSELTRRLMLRGFEDPSLFMEIPDGATLILIPDDDPEQAAAEIEVGIQAVKRGENVYFRHLPAAEFPRE
jgi:hypothetical protein